MSIKIAGQAAEGVLGAEVSRTQEAARIDGTDRSASGRSANTGGDSVEISDLAGRMESAYAADQSRIDDRISVLRAMYERGEYNPEAAAVSRALVTHALGGAVEESKA